MIVQLLVVAAVAAFGVTVDAQVTTLYQNMTVFDRQSIGSVIGQIGSGQIVGWTANAAPPYQIIYGSPGDASYISVTTNGLVSVSGIISRQQKSLYQFVAISTKNVWIAVNVYVIAVVNVGPVFSSASVNLSIPESAPVSALFSLTQVAAASSASNSSNNSAITCSIVSGNVGNVFRLVTSLSDSGALSLQLGLSGRLDYEVTRSYALVVRAFDSLSPPRTADLVVTVAVADVNDNAPQFNSSVYNFEIAETTPIGQKVGQVVATDPDSSLNGQIAYSLSVQPGSSGNSFVVNSVTGVVSVAKQLDYASQSLYLLLVTVTDGGTPPLQSTAALRIQLVRVVQSNPVVQLIFLSNDGSASIAKSAVSGDLVAQISVTDPSVLNPALLSANMTLVGGNGHFALQRSGSAIYLMVVADSLSSASSSYSLSVLITIGTKVLTKNFTLAVVPDDSSLGPRFSQSTYYGVVLDNSLPGTPVVTAVVVGGASNATYVYRLRGQTGSRYEWFQVDDSSGQIVTSSTFSCLSVGEYAFDVTATDTSLASQQPALTAAVVVIVMPVNSHPPFFTRPFYHANIANNTQPGTCVLKVEADSPGCGVNSVRYSLGPGGVNVPFGVNAVTGEVCLAAAGLSSSVPYYTFNVTATDPDGYQAVALVQLYTQLVYTQPPVFSAVTYSAYVDVNSPVGSTVVAVIASNFNPWARITYQIVSGNVGSVFVIVPETGVIKLKRLLRYQLSSFNLTVAAVDNNGLASPVNALVSVTVYNPTVQPYLVFTSQLYQFTMLSSASSGTRVDNGQLSLTVARNDVRYSLVSSSSSGSLFGIDQQTGYITRTANSLNIGQNPFVLLTVEARSTATSSSVFGRTQVNVSIADVGVYSPSFGAASQQISVREDAPLGTAIYAARAYYSNSVRLSARLRYRNAPNDTLAVDAVSGRLVLVRKLDYETTTRYTTTITACDSNNSNWCASITVFVSVLNVDDVAPVFTSGGGVYSFAATLPVPFDYCFGSVAANRSDADSGVVYFLRNGRFSDIFNVRSDSGAICARTVFDTRSSQLVYSLRVVAMKSGINSLSSTATVLIRLQSTATEVVPSFVNGTQYSFQIAEAQPSETVVGIVSVVGVANPVYVILSPNQFFSIVGNTGEILTRGILSVTNGTRYQFNVGVVGQPALVAHVTVELLGLNLNAPSFVRSLPSSVHVLENQPAGTYVTSLLAIDPDLGINGTVVYFFAQDNSRLYALMAAHFNLDNATGRITTKQPLQHDTEPEFTLKIFASDRGKPPRLSSPLILHVNVDPSAPAVSAPSISTSLSFTVMENVDVGTVVGSVGRGGGFPVGTIQYYIVSGNSFGSFGVNVSSGALYVALPLNYDDCPSYSITILAMSANAANSVQYAVNVSVISVYRHVPVFDSELVFVTVRENIPVGSGVTQVSASYDSVLGIVQYSVVSQFPNGSSSWFAVDSATGHVTTSAAIDREQVQQIAVVVAATYSSPSLAQPSRATALIVAAVADANDNPPSFERTNPNVNVSEDEAKGFPVLTVVADDPDSGNNGLVSYSISSGNEEGHFQLDSATGVLTVVRTLDHETTPTYQLNVIAYDNGFPSLTSSMLLTINVLDVNDNPPVFVSTLYTASVFENEPANTFVIAVSASDLDDPTTMNSVMTYGIPAGAANDNFAINSTTGVITTTVPLNREERDEWIITVYVHNDGLPALYDMTTVVVNVLDVNDNAPVFAPTSLSLSLQIPENANMAVVHTVEAYDADLGPNGEVSYHIADGNTDGRFYLDVTTGRLSCTPLDRELVAWYNLTVVAVDGGDPVLTAISYIAVQVLDDNDNDPIFQQLSYSAAVPENTRVGTEILALLAVDLDDGLNGNVTYSLSNEADGIFDVDPQTGVVTLLLSPDYEDVKSYSIDAQSTDACPYGPRSRTVRVNIVITDVNDNAPVFSQSVYSADIAVDLSVGSPVVTVSANDADAGVNARVSYSLTNSSQYFKIDSMTGTVIIAHVLDMSAIGVHTLTVVASDAGSPSRNSTGFVLINVGTVLPSSTLRFVNQTYTASVLEHSPVGTVVLTVQARVNGSSPAVYSLADGDNIFSIDQSTGAIKVANSIELDRETSERVRVIVIATTTTGAYDYATVWILVVDINDNAPRFFQERYLSKVWENMPRSTYVAQVSAADNDVGLNGQISYYIVSGNVQSAFDINPPTTGIIQTNIILDREIRDSYKLEIVAYDGGTPQRSSSVIMRIQVIDANDNTPYFPTYAPVSVHENSVVGNIITQVTATDVDLHPALSYCLNTANDTFSIDKYSGMISIIEPLDYELRTTYNLSVMVYDDGMVHSATTSVIINVIDDNDNAPVFTRTSYQVAVNELTVPGVYVVTVDATDKDSGNNAKITYSLLPTDAFSINSNTGAISTSKKILFNPIQPVVHLIVSATDNGVPPLSTTIAVEIQVVDVNNNAPVFSLASYSALLPEDAALGTTVVRVNAADADYTYDNTKLTYSIIGGNADRKFAITERTGEILLVASLDREHRPSYSLTVSVNDNGSPALASSTQVNITVRDVNDVAPSFSSSKYNATVREDASVGYRVVTLLANDPDDGDAGRVTYSIVSGDGVGVFSIDAGTGVLSVRTALDYETKNSYSLTVSAVDNGPSVNRFTSFVEVDINVLDVNEFRPMFPVMLYYEYVDMNQPVGTFVFTAEASDKDTGRYGEIRFSIVSLSDSPDNAFTIDPESGCVYTGVVFTTNSTYHLKVMAVDAGGLNATVSAFVVVQPLVKFTKSVYQFVVNPNARVGDVIGQVQVDMTSVDSPVEYFLRPPDEHFDVNRTTGVIYVIKDLQSWSSTTAASVLSGNRRRRRRSLQTVSLNVVARVNGIESTVVVQVTVNTATSTLSPCCGDNPLGVPVSSTTSGNAAAAGASFVGTPLVIVVVLASVAVVVFGVILFVCLRRHRTKKPLGPSSHDGAPSTIESSSVETFDVPPPMPAGFRLPPYRESKLSNEMGYGFMIPRSGNVNGTTSEMTGEDDGADSSGRGSAEKTGDDFDDEIQTINATIPELAQQQARRAARVPDSGIQPDKDDDLASLSSLRDHCTYLAKLGIDVGTAFPSSRTKKPSAAGLMTSGGPSVESIHQFSEEGGGEAVGHDISLGDRSSGCSRGLSGSEACSASLSNHDAKSLGPVVDAEAVFGGCSFNWDHLLDWKPEYRPLADVFAEIARLPDENAGQRRTVAKTIPTQIVPQQPSSRRRVTTNRSANAPPPIITNVPPHAVKSGGGLPGGSDFRSNVPTHHHSQPPALSSCRASLSSAGSSTSSSRQRGPVSIPASGLTYESSFASAQMSPSRTPSLSPLITRSPSVSPVDHQSYSSSHQTWIPLVVNNYCNHGAAAVRPAHASAAVVDHRGGGRRQPSFDSKEIEI